MQVIQVQVKNDLTAKHANINEFEHLTLVDAFHWSLPLMFKTKMV